ncbi:Cytochrome b2, partial [Colletotrichum shisoi]
VSPLPPKPRRLLDGNPRQSLQRIQATSPSYHWGTRLTGVVAYEQVTAFLSSHPGGKSVLLRNSGRDATAASDAVHPIEVLAEYLKPNQLIGNLESNVEDTSPPNGNSLPDVPADLLPSRGRIEDGPPVSHILSISEMEQYALKKLSPKAISYYASGTDDEITKIGNGAIFRSILLRPRVFVDCTRCSLSTKILNNPVGMPIYVSPAAMAKLAHPVGEAGIAAACSKFQTLQIISKNASMSPSAIVRAGPDATFAWQLYVLKDIEATERTLAQIRGIPQIKFIVLTLDAPFPGKREADERFKMAEVAGGAAPQAWGTESGLTWKTTLEWLTKHTSLPIVLKGIQTHEDAYAATLFPSVRGIIISNHGGRALDTTLAPIQVLLEIRKFCPQALDKMDVLIDGGIRRGTDVVKALALGAKGVGIGRAALYSLAVGGQAGVERALQILADETITAMRLLGVERVDQLGLRHISTDSLQSQLYNGPPGYNSALLGSINALPNYAEYFGLPANGNASTGIVFASFEYPGCSLPMFIGGRFILSFFATYAHTSAPLYLVELAPATYRGTIAGMYNTFYNVGSILATSAVYACHCYLSDKGGLDWRIPLWLQMVCPGLACVLIKFFPESPR